MTAEPSSAVGVSQDLRTRGHRFDPQLGQYSFPGLMIVIPTGFIPFSPMSIIVDNDFRCGYVGKQPVAWKEYLAEYRKNEMQKSMDMCTELTLKTVLNTIQSIISQWYIFTITQLQFISVFTIVRYISIFTPIC